MRRLLLFLIFSIIFVSEVFSIHLKLLKTYYGTIAPKSVEVSPDGKYAVIMNLEGMDVWFINTRTLKKKYILTFRPYRTSATGHNYQTRKKVPSFAEKPVEAAFSNQGDVYISFHNGKRIVNFNYLHPHKKYNKRYLQRAKLIDKQTKKKRNIRIPQVRVESTPKVIAVTPNQKYILVANWFGSSISVINKNTFRNIKNIKLGGKYRVIPRGIAITSDSQTAYVANMGGGSISIVDLKKLKEIKRLYITRNPRHLAISKNDKYLYITENAGGKVIKYNLRTRQIVKQRRVGSQARTLVLSQDEKYVFVAVHKSNKIMILDTKNLKILKTYEFPKPMGISVSPNDKQLWVTSYGHSFVKVFQIIR